MTWDNVLASSRRVISTMCCSMVVVYLIVAIIAMTGIDFKRAYVRRLHKVLYWSDYPIHTSNLENKVDRIKLRRSIVYYKLLTKVIPNLGRGYSLLGYCYYYLDDYEKSLKWYKKAQETQPYYFWFDYNLAVLYFNQGKYASSLEHLKNITSLNLDEIARISIISSLSKLEESKRKVYFKMAVLFSKEILIKAKKLTSLNHLYINSINQYGEIPDQYNLEGLIKPLFHPLARIMPVGQEIYYMDTDN